MPKANSLLDFVEKQEILNNIHTSITKIYADDPAINDEDFFEALTLKTLDVMDHMDGVYLNIVDDPGIISVAKEFKTTKEIIAKDIIELMLYTTIARQRMLLDELENKED